VIQGAVAEWTKALLCVIRDVVGRQEVDLLWCNRW